MAEETETFAFQAEINQLLSLIINVRLPPLSASSRDVAHRVFIFSEKKQTCKTQSSPRVNSCADPKIQREKYVFM